MLHCTETSQVLYNKEISMEINAKQLICNIILPLQLLAPLHFHCLFRSAFRDLASEQGEPGVKARGGERKGHSGR